MKKDWWMRILGLRKSTLGMAGFLVFYGTVSADLIHRYSFNGNADDSVGTANGVTRHSSSGTTVQYNGGQAVIDGTGGYIDLPNGLISGLTNITVELWVTKYDPVGAWSRILDFGTSEGGEDLDGSSTSLGNGGYYMLLFASVGGGGQPRFAVSDTLPGYNHETPVLTGPEPIPAGTEIHYAMTYGSNGARLIVNGVEVARGPVSIPLSTIRDTNVWLGRPGYGGDAFFNGAYNEVRIHDDILTLPQLLASKAAGPDTIHYVVPAPDSIELQVNPSMIAGTTQDPKINATYATFGAVVLCASDGIIASTATNVVQVQPDGSLNAISLGTATITAAVGGKTNSATVVVGPPPVHTVLKHRYSFNEVAGSTIVTDSVASSNGVVHPPTTGTAAPVVISNGVANFLGGTYNTCGYIALPSYLISSEFINLTVEMWMSWNGPANSSWQYVWSFGSSSKGSDPRVSGNGLEYIMFTPRRGGGGARVEYRARNSGNYTSALTDSAASDATPTGREIHVVATVAPGINYSALWIDGQLKKIGATPQVGTPPVPAPLSSLTDFNCWLGVSQWNDPPLNGQLNELRIYEGVLDFESIVLNGKAGPNVLPILVPGTLQSISLTASPLYLEDPVPNRALLLGNYQNVSGLEITNFSGVNFRSTDTNVFTVARDGALTPVAVGTAELIANYGLLSATAPVSVLGPVALYSTPVTNYAGSPAYTLPLFADFPGGRTNAEVTGFTGVSRRSADTNVAVINDAGQVTFIGKPGVATITSVYGGLSNQTLLTIVPLPGRTLLHRYGFNEAPNTTRVEDTVGAADGEAVQLQFDAAFYGNFSGSGQFVMGPGPFQDPAKTNSYVNLPNGLISSLGSVTVEGWFTWFGGDSSQRLFDFGMSSGAPNGSGGYREDAVASPARSYFSLSPQGGRLLFEISAGSGPATPGLLAATNQTILVSNQSHFALVYDPPRGVVRLYVNGVRAGTAAATLPLSVVDDRNNWVGRSQWEVPYFHGAVDELRIYDGPSADEDIASDFATGPDALTMSDWGPLQSLTLNVVPLLLNNPATTPATVRGNFQNVPDVDLVSLSNVVFWSADTNVFTVTGDGALTSVAVGTAELIASCGSLSATAVVSVLGPVALHSTPVTNYTGSPAFTLPLFADFPGGGTNVDVTGYTGVTRGSSEPNVAVISDTGEVLFVGDSGKTTITSTYGGLTNQTLLTIAPLPARTLIHRYSLGEARNSTSVEDTVGSADGLIVQLQTNSSFYGNFTGSGQFIMGPGPFQKPPTTNAYINLPNGLISGLDSVTVAGWFTWFGGDSGQRLFDFGMSSGAPDGNGGYGEDAVAAPARSYFSVSPQEGRLLFEISPGSDLAASGVMAATNQTITVSNRSHFAIVYDPPRGVARLYVNGVRAGTATASVSLSAVDDRNNWIGRSQWEVPYFHGAIDEFRIYHGPSADADIATDFTIGPDALPTSDWGPLQSLTLQVVPLLLQDPTPTLASLRGDFLNVTALDLTRTSGVQFYSSDTNVFTVSAEGALISRAAGTAELIASFGSLSTTAAVSVLAPVALYSTPVTNYAGSPAFTLPLFADFPELNTNVNVTAFAGVTRASSETNVAVINDAGVVRYMGAAGTTTIASSYGGLTNQTELTILAVPVRYVDINSTNPAPPFGSWATAATSIQDAIDAAVPGDTVLVAAGVYRTGGHSVVGVTNEFDGSRLAGTTPTIPGAWTNRVAITKPIRVESINGPELTVIEGSTDLTNAVRCAFLTNGATLSGFTLTNGFAVTGGEIWAATGGGLWALSTNALISNCIIVSNQAAQGGGVFSGTLERCRLLNNRAVYAGGGALASTLRQCALTGNFAGGAGGGAGGGAAYCDLNNCTIVRNSASAGGGGVGESSMNNCIVYDNTAGFSSLGENYESSSANSCCTTPLPTNGTGNITNEPAFVDPANGNLHLQSNSPCINSGNNAFVASGTDLDGKPRMVGGTVDIGAYEFQAPASILSYSWLRFYGLSDVGAADHLDSDEDGADNWREWRAGTDPTNAASVLRMLPPTRDDFGVALSWQSVTDRIYYLQSTMNLITQPTFTTLRSNIEGQANVTSFIDTNGAGSGVRFYRVGVQ